MKKKQDSDIEKWIDRQLDGTSVTVVLVGSNTAHRKWIDYEIKSSYNRGNGMLAIHVHNQENSKGLTGAKGINPFSYWHITRDGRAVYFTELFKTYDWVLNKGYDNMGDWIESAAKARGK